MEDLKIYSHKGRTPAAANSSSLSFGITATTQGSPGPPTSLVPSIVSKGTHPSSLTQSSAQLSSHQLFPPTPLARLQQLVSAPTPLSRLLVPNQHQRWHHSMAAPTGSRSQLPQLPTSTFKMQINIAQHTSPALRPWPSSKE